MFEWDEDKRKLTIEKHGIDFLDIAELFYAPHLLLEARSEIEARQIAVGEWNGKHYAIVFTMRDEVVRIITARRARRDEREQYQALYSGRDPGDEV